MYSEEDSARFERVEKRNRHLIVRGILSEINTDCNIIGNVDHSPATSEEQDKENVISENSSSANNTEKNHENIQKELEILKVLVKKLTEENLCLKKENANLEKNMSSLIEKEVNIQVENIIGSYFSETQIKKIINKKRVSEWSSDDIANAFTLRSLSPKCYKYLRLEKGFPLPSESTLKERVKNFYCEPGILVSVLDILKEKSDTFTEQEKLTIISFDEMSIKKEWSYDKGTDVLYKPHDNVQVVMLRGLVKKWRQPIYFQFDQGDMYEVLLEIITKLEDIGYAVVGVVHDMGSKNLALWKKLKIDPLEDKISFRNPRAEREVFVFSDIPHLIKLVRNNMIDSGFFSSNGNLICIDGIREMLSKTKSEYGLAYKISETHLNVTGQQRQRVKLAVQLLSRSCGNSLRYLGEKGLLVSKTWEETSEFILLMNDFFDIMNSSCKYENLNKSCAFGVDLEKQTSTLYKVIEVMNTMRVKKSKTKSLYRFQKGIILSCKSTIGLYDMLKSTYGVEYILTERLNQDCLEHFFGCIRQISGTHDHPNAVNFKFRLKKLLLGKNIKIVSEKTNVTASEETTFEIGTKHVTEKNKERELAVEICLTSQIFLNSDFDFENDDLNDEEEFTRGNTDVKIKTTEGVIEEEALRYIGGYVVRKFVMKYPNLGNKTVDNGQSSETWIDHVNKGDLYTPSPEFLSQLKVMRDLFNTVHGKSLCEGKGCVQTLCKEMKELLSAMRKEGELEVPLEVIYFFAKISIYFKIRYENTLIKNKKRQNEPSREAVRKKMKITT